MENISSTLGREHRHCDDLLAATENAVQRGDWRAARQHFDDFVRHLRDHLGKEEEVLFPAIERKTGSSQGPTQVMRMEHEDMRGQLHSMAEDLDRKDGGHFLGLAETLLLLIQQHNLKEEGILYPLADQALADELEEVLARLAARKAQD